jgi:hypothetical protein
MRAFRCNARSTPSTKSHMGCEGPPVSLDRRQTVGLRWHNESRDQDIGNLRRANHLHEVLTIRQSGATVRQRSGFAASMVAVKGRSDYVIASWMVRGPSAFAAVAIRKAGDFWIRRGQVGQSFLSTATQAHAIQRVVLVRDADELIRGVAALPRGVNPHFVIKARAVSSAEAQRVAERLTRLKTECGCSAGAGSMMVGFALAAAWLAMRDGAPSVLFAVHLPIALAAAICCAIGGKVAAVGWARRRFRREVRLFAQRLSTRTV